MRERLLAAGNGSAAHGRVAGRSRARPRQRFSNAWCSGAQAVSESQRRSGRGRCRARGSAPRLSRPDWNTKPRASTNASRATSRRAPCMRSSRSAKRGAVPGLPRGRDRKPVKSAGVIGAGTMGGGIAICFANAGIPVTLLDANPEGLDRGLANVDGTYQSMVDRGRLTARRQGATHAV